MTENCNTIYIPQSIIRIKVINYACNLYSKVLSYNLKLNLVYCYQQSYQQKSTINLIYFDQENFFKQFVEIPIHIASSEMSDLLN